VEVNLLLEIIKLRETLKDKSTKLIQ